MHNNFAIAIHGGAGTLDPKTINSDQKKAYNDGLKVAIEAGYAVLKKGGNALEAVEIAVISLEDCPLFNAGRGSVFTHDQKVELDASIMDGFTGEAGAVASVSLIKNPVSLAKNIMVNSDHVLLSGVGAMEYAFKHGFKFESESYFHTDFRLEQLLVAKSQNRVTLDHNILIPKPIGTVGAVALDSSGKIAAATSTGGMTNKRFGRLGDTPIIGAGTWADHNCGVSCTGHGEFFIRNVVAYDIACLIKYKGLSIEEACSEVVFNKLAPIGGEGGLIAIDKQGVIHFSFNSVGMYRASYGDKTGLFTGIFRD